MNGSLNNNMVVGIGIILALIVLLAELGCWLDGYCHQ